MTRARKATLRAYSPAMRAERIALYAAKPVLLQAEVEELEFLRSLDRKPARKPRPYFLLCSRAAADAPFAIQFGDKDRETVAFERQSYRDAGDKASDLRVIRAASSRKADCDAAVAKLNRIAA